MKKILMFIYLFFLLSSGAGYCKAKQKVEYSKKKNQADYNVSFFMTNSYLKEKSSRVNEGKKKGFGITCPYQKLSQTQKYS